MVEYDRRSAIKSIAVAGVAGFAGCTNSTSGGDSPNNSSGSVNGSSSKSSQKEVTAKFASSFQSGTYENQAIERFKQKMADDTDGNFNVEHVAGGSYGGESELTQTVSKGSIEGMGAGALPIVLWQGKYWFPSSQWVIHDYDHLLKILYSDEFSKMFESIRKDHNIRRIGRSIYMGMRSHMANKPVRSPEDASGLKIRIPDISSWVKIWSAVGTNPVSISADEAYSALQTGTADAITTDVNQALSAKYYEVQSHYNATEQVVGNRNLWINESFFQDLDDTYKDLVLKNGWEASVEIAEKSQKEESKSFEQLREKDITVVDDVNYDAFKQSATNEIEKLFGSDWALSLSWVKKQQKQGKIPDGPMST